MYQYRDWIPFRKQIIRKALGEIEAPNMSVVSPLMLYEGDEWVEVCRDIIRKHKLSHLSVLEIQDMELIMPFRKIIIQQALLFYSEFGLTFSD
jgi:hypothetical protein